MQDDEEINAFVGGNSAYYRARWRTFAEPAGSIVSFNWAACIGQVVWCIYRKLYVPALVMLVVYAAHAAIVLYLFANQLLPEAVLTASNWLLAIPYYAAPGFYGNYWYWRKFKRVARCAELQQHNPAEQLAYLRDKGRTNKIVPVSLVVLFTAAALWAVYQAHFTGYVFDATGPLTLDEVNANFLSHMDKEMSDQKRACVRCQIADDASAVGDPAHLDADSVAKLQDEALGDVGEHIRGTALDPLAGEGWDSMEPFERRIVLAQILTMRARLSCD